MIRINASLSIPKREITFVYGVSSGPGGQHVNKVATKATLLFSIPSSRTLSISQKKRLHERLSTRVNKEGVLRVASSRFRSQKANKEAVTQRFASLVREALQEQKERKRTVVSKNQREKRIQEKKLTSAKKRLRAKMEPNDE